MLTSTLFAGVADLAAVAAGQRTIRAGESSASVALIQQALVTLGFALPSGGADGIFGGETGTVVSAFKVDRGLSPADPVVGKGTMARLDRELSFLDGVVDPTYATDRKLLRSEPFTAGVLDAVLPDLDIGQALLDTLELGDKLCFSMSMAILDAPQVASFVGRFVEPKIEQDYCKQTGPCTADDFFDTVNSPTPYTDFLRAHNPTISPAVVTAVGSRSRPDIISHRPGATPMWYEIKPLSPGGVRDGLAKGIALKQIYKDNGFPYKPGTTYRPSSEIELGHFLTPQGEDIEVFLEVRRLLPGLLFYRLCLRGDYVQFLNRVRVVAGLLAILAALAPELLAAGAAAEEVTAFLALLRAAATALGLGSLPSLVPVP
ncbi:peptidoglycan-binding domain-containing protein [Cryptosporangium minutisporangium]|uniref:Peptidoglycan binding-like domain-containing protein n=1 Tax=Cryptosporangium minutisporangium TaxID=113569 RepID=A0ABP6SRT4_9ACTN